MWNAKPLVIDSPPSIQVLSPFRCPWQAKACPTARNVAESYTGPKRPSRKRPTRSGRVGGGDPEPLVPPLTRPRLASVRERRPQADRRRVFLEFLQDHFDRLLQLRVAPLANQRGVL